MKILLDTHIILWSLANDKRLSDKAKNIILDDTNSLVCSTASFWEIEIKHLIHPDQMPDAHDVVNYCKQAGYSIIPVNYLETLNLQTIHTKTSHKDPFDRLLISQAKTYGMYLLTSDSELINYNETCVINA